MCPKNQSKSDREHCLFRLDYPPSPLNADYVTSTLLYSFYYVLTEIKYSVVIIWDENHCTKWSKLIQIDFYKPTCASVPFSKETYIHTNYVRNNLEWGWTKKKVHAPIFNAYMYIR